MGCARESPYGCFSVVGKVDRIERTLNVGVSEFYAGEERRK